jgi:hypothetical protein
MPPLPPNDFIDQFISSLENALFTCYYPLGLFI